MLLRAGAGPGRGPGGEGVGRRSGGVRRPGDARSELLELAVDVLIPPVHVVGAVDERRTVRGEGGEDQRRACAQVADPTPRRRGGGPGRGSTAWCASSMSIRAPSLRSSASQSMRSSKIGLVHVRRAASPGSAARTAAAGGPWRGPGRARSRCRRPASRRAGGRSRRPRSMSRPQSTGTPTLPSASSSAPTWSQARALERQPAAGHRRGHEERAGLDPVGHTWWSAPRRRRRPWTSIVSGAVRSTSAPIFCRNVDQVVHLRLAGRRPDHRVAVGQGRGEHRVLGAHDGHVGERDLAAAQPARRLREVVAVAVLDLRAERPHRVDVEVDGPPADPVAARVADDHPAEPREQRPQQDEARRASWPPPRAARTASPRRRGDLVDVGRGWSTTTPRSRSVSAMTRTSSISGTFVNRQRSPVSVAAASSFSAAFFAPLIGPCRAAAGRPRSGRPRGRPAPGWYSQWNGRGVSHASL